ncbi:hypothetical protein SALBM135S_05902 [Streptomyces alboniger]
MKAPAFSVASTAKPLAAPSSLTVSMPVGIESCRKPAVLEKTRTLSPALAPWPGLDAAGPDTHPMSRAAAAVAVRSRARLRMVSLPSQPEFLAALPVAAAFVVKVKSSTS